MKCCANSLFEWKFRFEVRIKGGFRFGLGMVYLETAIIALIVLSIALQVILMRVNAKLVANSAAFLDSQLAEALKSILESLPEVLADMKNEFMPQEPVNPLAQMFMQHLQAQMNPALNVTEVLPRNEDGKFSTENA